MSDSTSATTIASYTMAIHMALEANGHDAAAVFKAAGLSDAPSQDPLDRYTTVQMATLFREAVKSTGNPAFGLVAARFLHPSNVHALGYALLASASLGKQTDHYQQMFMEETANAVGAHTVIPVHWDDFFAELSDDVAPLPWALDNLDASFHAMADRHDGDFFVLPPFQRFTLTPPTSASAQSSPVPAETAP